MARQYEIKHFSLLKAKEGLSRDEFKRYYEERHAPLVLKIGSPYLADYRRSYVQGPGIANWLPTPDGEMDNFDVLSEFWFKTQEDYDKFMSALHENSDAIDADEKNFLDQKRVWIFASDEHVSSIPE